MSPDVGIGTEEDRWRAGRSAEEGARGSTVALERAYPKYTQRPMSRFQAQPRLGTSPPSSPPSSPVPAPAPAPAPCCRTRRWQARWCSCPRTNPPPSCQPAAGPTSAGCSWPLWGIGAAAPAAEKSPELLLEAKRGGRSFIHNESAAGCGASPAGPVVLRSACWT